MSTDALAYAFARQALADFRTYQLLEREAVASPEAVPVCHRLLFLQMACEKLSRARLYRQTSAHAQVKDLHTYTEKQLPTILRETYTKQNRSRPAGNLLEVIRRLAASVQALAPAAKGGGSRPDNCEYPWVDGSGAIVSPLEHAFECSALLRGRGGASFLKLLASSLESAVREYER